MNDFKLNKTNQHTSNDYYVHSRPVSTAMENPESRLSQEQVQKIGRIFSLKAPCSAGQCFDAALNALKNKQWDLLDQLQNCATGLLSPNGTSLMDALLSQRNLTDPFSFVELGIAAACLGENERALAYYTQALGFIKKLDESPDNLRKQYSLLDRMGKAWKKLNNSTEALKYYIQAQDILKKLSESPENLIEQAAVLDKMGEAWEDLNNPIEALEYYDQALRCYDQKRNESPENLRRQYSLLYGMGKIWEQLSNPTQALKSYTQALECIQKLSESPENLIEQASVLDKMGEAWEDLNNPIEALEYYDQALKCYDKALEFIKKLKHSSENLRRQYSSLYGISKIWEKLDNPKEALKYYTQALECVKKLDESTENLRRQHSLLDRMSQAWKKLSNPAEASRYDFQSLDCILKLSESPEDLIEQALVLDKTGEAWAGMDNRTEALKCYIQALDIVQKLHESLENLKIQCALLDKIGQTWEDLNNLTEALKCYHQKGGLLFSIQIEESNKPVGALIEQASELDRMGKVREKANNPIEALKYYARALEYIQKLNESPESLRRQYSLLYGMRKAWKKLNNPAETLKCYTQAVEILKKLQFNKPPDTALQLALERRAQVNSKESRERDSALDEQEEKGNDSFGKVIEHPSRRSGCITRVFYRKKTTIYHLGGEAPLGGTVDLHLNLPPQHATPPPSIKIIAPIHEQLRVVPRFKPPERILTRRLRANEKNFPIFQRAYKQIYESVLTWEDVSKKASNFYFNPPGPPLINIENTPLLVGGAAARFFAALCRKYGGFVIGESHPDIASKALLEERMIFLAHMGVRVIFYEKALPLNLVESLWKMQAEGKTSSEDLDTILEEYANRYRQDAVLLAAVKAGIKIIPIDHDKIAYTESGGLRGGLERTRNMNYFAYQIVREYQKLNPSHAFVIWAGMLHAGDVKNPDLPGLGSLLGLPSVCIKQDENNQIKEIQRNQEVDGTHFDFVYTRPPSSEICEDGSVPPDGSVDSEYMVNNVNNRQPGTAVSNEPVDGYYALYKRQMANKIGNRPLGAPTNNNAPQHDDYDYGGEEDDDSHLYDYNYGGEKDDDSHLYEYEYEDSDAPAQWVGYESIYSGRDYYKGAISSEDSLFFRDSLYQAQFAELNRSHPTETRLNAAGFSQAIALGASVKNRYKNILPNNKTRYTTDDPNFYYNANNLFGGKLIAAEAPIEAALVDFWTMVDHGKPIIVMLTNLVENQTEKCIQYWPLKPESEQSILSRDPFLPSFKITNRRVSTEKLNEPLSMNISHLGLKKVANQKESPEQEIVHIQMCNWPDFGVIPPQDLAKFIEYVYIMHACSPDSPLLVHCSAGIGRSGVFCLAYHLYCLYKQGQKFDLMTELLRTAQQMRGERNGMILTVEQYKLTGEALKLLIKSPENRRFLCKLIVTEAPTGTSLFNFWRTVNDSKPMIVVMLGNFVEKQTEKCIQYWPSPSELVKNIPSPDPSLPSFKIINKRTFTGKLKKPLSINTSQLGLKTVANQKESPEQEVVHIQMCNWPDVGIIPASDLAEFIHCVYNMHEGSLESPLLVHCGAGMDCSGAFCLAYHLYCLYKQGKKINLITDLLRAEQQMRSERKGMNLTVEQYALAGEALKLLIKGP